ncbi:MAG: bifunctional riboflavin kinase/FAD synthetase [Bacteroidota bacterium]
MIILEGAESFPKQSYTVVTIGTFDGVHVGHQEILKKIVNQAKDNNGVSVVVTFWPHPRFVLQGVEESGLKLLNTFEEKSASLAEQGIDYLIKIPFTKEFSQTTSDEFIRKILIDQLGTTHLVIGYDHHFGKDREGSFEYLQAHIDEYGFTLQEIPRQDIDDVGVSSTKIRNALSKGEVDMAKSYLGKNYAISGDVIHGEKLGRKIGYPTANVRLSEPYKMIPANGIYAVKVFLENKIAFGMLYIGTKPTLTGDSVRVIEVNIFDFNDDIYDQQIRLEFLKYIRDDMKFEDLDQLTNQITKDKEVTLDILKHYPND